MKNIVFYSAYLLLGLVIGFAFGRLLKDLPNKGTSLDSVGSVERASLSVPRAKTDDMASMPPVRKESPARQSNHVPLHGSLWEQLRDGQYRDFANGLREQGVPEKAIAAMIEMRINEEFDAETSAVQQVYWRDNTAA